MAQRNGYRNQGRGNKRSWRVSSGAQGQGDSFREREPREDSKEKVAPTDSTQPNVSNDKSDSINSDTSPPKKEKKFGNRSRLYVGNLSRNLSEDDLKTLFEPFGESSQIYIEKEKNFGFVRMAYRDQAEKAIASLNGKDVKGRELRVRFAASSCSVKVTNLHPTVSNELLAEAFTNMFGEVEHAVVVTDERGKSLGYGVVDFAKKFHAISAIEKCRNGCFILTKSPMPVVVTELTRENNDEGLPEKQIPRTPHYNSEREVKPRVALHGTPEFDMAMRWKALYDNEKARRDELEAHLKENRRQLEHEMEQYHHHEEANYLRIQLAEHQREQQRLQECLRQHERFMEGSNNLPPPPPPPPPPPAGSSLIPAPPSHMVPHHTSLPSHNLPGEHPPMENRPPESLLPPPPLHMGGPPPPHIPGPPLNQNPGYLLPGPPPQIHPTQYQHH